MRDELPQIAFAPCSCGTARAITNLLFAGTFSRYRDIRFIFTHAGGNMPMMVGRMKQYGPASLSTLAPLGETARDLHTLGLSSAELRAIGRENALLLLPTLAAR